MHGVRARPLDIAAGNAAMYFPEANVLVPTATDPDSKTPAFKCVPVRVQTEQPDFHPSAAATSNGRLPLAQVPSLR
jgi:hypothetical protein